MAKKSSTDSNGQPVNKSAAIRDYLAKSKDAMPKEIVAALAGQGITVSPQMVSVIKAKTKVKSARTRSKASLKAKTASASSDLQQSKGLDAALLLYKAALGTETPAHKIREAFLSLVEILG
jgi:hypothetical protein